MNSQLMCSNIGHGNKKVIQAIKDQAYVSHLSNFDSGFSRRSDELTYAGPGFATRVRAEIGPLLAKHTPGPSPNC
jgi:taurine--2-oxoglutarate transaminase